MKNVIFILLSLAFLVTCSEKESTEPPPLQTKEVLEYADPLTDNLLDGFNKGNYEQFSRDFDDQMMKALHENAFIQTREKIHSRIGSYISREFSKIERKGEFVAVIYKAEFEKEKEVTVRVVFRKVKDKNAVTGLWFNSPKLRK